jgi:hypothetical protein
MQWFHIALETSDLEPLLIAAKLHYDFVYIHPFDDGNGRISRLLMNYVFLRYDLPPVIIKSKDKAGYLRALNRADLGDFEAFADYIAEQACWSLELCVKAAKGESVEEEDDLDKEIEVLNKRLKEKVIHENTVNEIDRPKFVEEVIFPMFKELDKKISKFDIHFFKPFKQIRILSNNKYQEVEVDSQLEFEDKWQKATDQLKIPLTRELAITADKIIYTSNLQGFKSSISARNFYLEVEVKLLPYHFQVNFNQKSLDFSFSKLEDLELKKKVIISDLVKKLIEEMERHND